MVTTKSSPDEKTATHEESSGARSHRDRRRSARQFPAGSSRPRPWSARSFRSRATVWREGHDAVAATLVVRHHGAAYPQLVAGPASPSRDPVPDRAAGVAAVRGSNRSGCRCRRAGPPTSSTASSSPTPSGLWTFRVDGWGDPIATWRNAVLAKLEAGQSEAELSNDLLIGAQLLERAATGVPRQQRASAAGGGGRAAQPRRTRSPAPARH